MKRLMIAALAALLQAASLHAQGLKDVIGKDMLIGVALNKWQSSGVCLSYRHCAEALNSVVAENCMKSENYNPVRASFILARPTAFVALPATTTRR